MNRLILKAEILILKRKPEALIKGYSIEINTEIIALFLLMFSINGLI